MNLLAIRILFRILFNHLHRGCGGVSSFGPHNGGTWQSAKVVNFPGVTQGRRYSSRITELLLSRRLSKTDKSPPYFLRFSALQHILQCVLRILRQLLRHPRLHIIKLGNDHTRYRQVEFPCLRSSRSSRNIAYLPRTRPSRFSDGLFEIVSIPGQKVTISAYLITVVRRSCDGSWATVNYIPLRSRTWELTRKALATSELPVSCTTQQKISKQFVDE